MVSYAKSAAAVFFASAIGSALGHKAPENLDKEKFAAELKQLRLDHAEIIKKQKLVKQNCGNGRGNGQGNGCRSDTDLPNGNSSEGSIIPGGTTVDTFLDGHDFIPPSPSDSRGPCPFINVMANHGFINRNGRDVPVFDIPALANILFDLPSEGFVPVATLAIFAGQAVTQANGEVLLDIERLWDRPGEERDLSMIFPNPGLELENLNTPASEGFPENNDEVFLDFRYTISQAQLDELLSRDVNGFLTQEIHNEFLQFRLDESTPDHFFRFSEEDVGVASGQYVLPVLILGEDATDFSFAPTSHIDGLWSEFRFPEGYAPRSVRHGDAFDAAQYQSDREGFQAINRDTILRTIAAFWEEEAAEVPPVEVKKAAKKAVGNMRAAARKAAKNARIAGSI